eukprot:8765253-Alexandrium_andersonii.AAC.1
MAAAGSDRQSAADCAAALPRRLADLHHQLVSGQRQPSTPALRRDGGSRKRRFVAPLDVCPGVPMTLQQASARREHVAKK